MNVTENSMSELTVWRNSLFWEVGESVGYGKTKESKEFFSGSNGDCTWKLSITNEKSLYLILIKSIYFKIKVACNLRNGSYEYNKVLDFCVGDEKILMINNRCNNEISCKIEILNVEKKGLKEKEYQSKILKDFESLLHDNNFNDVQLQVLETTLHANKAILSARSPYFEAMFNSDMEENKTGIVKIDDTDPKIIEDLLYFIYTGKITNLKENTKELLVAANKYALDDLKIICESALSQNITVDNAIDMLKFSDLHNANDLKNEIIDFFIDNVKGIQNTKDFVLLKESRKDIAIEILEAIINHKK